MSALTLHFLGTCSGTEPIHGRHHSAIAISYAGRLFWFDAGENCSYSAHLAGLDLPSIEAVFVSHTHMDHIGGLPNLLWTLGKLASRSDEARRKLAGRRIGLFLPDQEVYHGILKILAGTEGGFKTVFSLEPVPCADGMVYQHGGVRVTAQHNLHMGAGHPFRSFSFRADFGSRSVVYSADVRSLSDCLELVDDCDVFLMETGHHRVEAICAALRDSGKRFGQLIFTHHGRAILRDPAGELDKAQRFFGNRVALAEDGMVLTL